MTSTEDNAELLAAKIVSMVILGAFSLTLGLIPIKVKSRLAEETTALSRRTSLVMSSLSCFGAGVILTTCLTHMLPDVNDFLKSNIKYGHVTDNGLPLAEIAVISGFLMIYWVEELGHAAVTYLYSSAKNNANTEVDLGKTDIHEHPIDVIAKGAEASFQAKLRGLIAITALSLHDVFEGITIGLIKEASFVWYLLFAVSAHKLVISFCLGVQFVMSGHLSSWLIVLYQSIFAFISPIGIGIGMILIEVSANAIEGTEDLQSPTITFLQALASGTLLYVVFFEVLEKERKKDKAHGLLQVLCFSLGFVFMVLLQLVENQDYVPEELSNICVLDAANFSSGPVNVTCSQGVLKLAEDSLMN